MEELVQALVDALRGTTVSGNSSSFDVRQPECFNLRQSHQWSQWFRRFEVYRLASGLAEKSEEQQINVLVYSLGEDGDELLTSIGLPPEKRQSYNLVKEKLNDYFSVKKNLIFERSRFLQRVQHPGETIDDYINELYKLLGRCEWKCDHCKFNNELLLLKLVSGMSDRHLSTELQLQNGLTFEVARERARLAERIEGQQDIIRKSKSENPALGVDYLQRTKKKSPHRINQEKGARRRCYRCGREHESSSCPFKKTICFFCRSVGHLRSCCPRRKTRNVEKVSEESNSGSAEEQPGPCLDKDGKLEAIYYTSKASKSTCPFYVTILVNERPTKFKIDTGADVCVLGPKDAKRLNLNILKTDKVLRGPGNIVLDVIGCARATLKYASFSYDSIFYIISGQKEPLLGRDAISEFGLLKGTVAEIDCNTNIFQQYPDIFSGLGEVKGNPYKIIVKSDAKPYSISTPRRVPLPLRTKVKEELDSMVKRGVIEPISEPTDWCAPIVVVRKKNGSIRLCVDYTELNKFVLRERIILPSLEELLPSLCSAKVFSKLDANCGFWQVPLEIGCRKLTTFITPFGRYFYKRLPFGICSAPEYFQKRMSEAIEGLEGVVNVADDFLVFGKDEHEHDLRLREVLERFRERGITLNKDKCEFRLNTVKFLGHVVENGLVSPDPGKVKAIQDMKPPRDKKELRSFLGLANYLMKFIPNLSNSVKPLSELLTKHNEWVWTDLHEKSLNTVKHLISEAVSLVMFDVNRATRVSADASSFGLGAVIEQNINGSWRPVQFLSRMMSEVERRYAQIEKEALGLTWACEKFSKFLIGNTFELLTDHKPLVEILSKKPIADLSARLQRFRMRLQPFDFHIRHIKGKEFTMPDVLSRHPLGNSEDGKDVIDETEFHVQGIFEVIPISDLLVDSISKAQHSDSQCSLLKRSILSGDWSPWINTDFYGEQGNLVVHNDVIMRGSRVFIPPSYRTEILSRLHKGHMGINKCLGLARVTVWWPGVTRDVKLMVSRCRKCLENSINPCEPLIPSDIPDRPWQIVGTDLLEYNTKMYMVVQDYFSKYIELVRLSRIDSKGVIVALKDIFARHGIPVILRSDPGSQFNSKEFAEFSREYNFNLVTSSPKHSQSNGQSERAVRTAKNILKKNEDLADGLLAYRSSPLECGISPSELLFGRKLRTTLPTVEAQLNPKWPDLSEYKKTLHDEKFKYKFYFDRRHRARNLERLMTGRRVWITDLKRYGTVLRQGHTIRDYVLDVGGREMRRNRKFLIPVSRIGLEESSEGGREYREHQEQPLNKNRVEHRGGCEDKGTGSYVTRSGRRIQPPKRFTP